MHRVRFAALALALAACGGVPPSPTQIGPPDAPGPSVPAVGSGTVSDGAITLSAVAEPVVVAPGEIIEVTATLSNDGPEDVEIFGSGTGIVFFSVTRLEDGLTSGPPGMNGDCSPHPLTAGERTEVPFSKNGGYSPEDPNAAFMEAYLAEPELTLPAGTWRIDVAAYGSLASGCLPPLDLNIALIVTVSE